MDDNSIMPFGKHKGKKMREVPHGWLTWMHDRGKLSRDVKKYAEENVNILQFVAEKIKAKRVVCKSSWTMNPLSFVFANA